MHASAQGWREQDRVAKRLILMLKTLLMVMFKTSKLWLTKKKHLHTGKVEQMEQLTWVSQGEAQEAKRNLSDRCISLRIAGEAVV